MKPYLEYLMPIPNGLIHENQLEMSELLAHFHS